MGYKVFVSYKYHDMNVQPLPSVWGATCVRNYVDRIQDQVLPRIASVYKGENDGEDLSLRSEEYIWSHLKDRIYDSSITIVLISPNMKDANRWQRSQWIPWEIAYSLRETTRNDRTSHRNAILAIELPDRYGRYDYFSTYSTFPILASNIKNGYICLTDWEKFTRWPQAWLDKAIEQKNNTPDSLIVKTLYN